MQKMIVQHRVTLPFHLVSKASQWGESRESYRSTAGQLQRKISETDGIQPNLVEGLLSAQELHCPEPQGHPVMLGPHLEGGVTVRCVWFPCRSSQPTFHSSQCCGSQLHTGTPSSNSASAAPTISHVLSGRLL